MTHMGRVARTAVSQATVRIVTWVWLAVLIVGSMQPARPGIIKGGLAHSVLHWVAFGGAAALLCALSQTRRQEILRAAAIVLLGFSLEVFQYSMYLNSMEWNDVRDDSLAVLAAWVIYRMTGAWKPQSEESPA